MIKVKNLYHSYNNDDNYAVNDVNFEIKKGEIFGFLGPSGAGKSTTQNILVGLLQLQQGEVEVAGYDIKHIKNKMFNKIGMSFEQSNVYNKMSGIENLEFYRKLFDVETRDPMELIRLVGLDGKENVKAERYSKGMKHRLTFARSMINNPKMWFLDEPTTGLDPAIASNIKDIIKRENEKGVTIFLTTHNMYIADELCHRVAFIVDGKIRLIDSPKALKLKYGEKLVDVEYFKSGQLIKAHFSTVFEAEKERLIEVIKNYDIQTMHTKEATLEEIFIKVTGRGLV
ncbi:ABC transporter ATP-binding protein [Fusibacter ferrireducens]|uniref:ABC transporter ATP-binding protein n=1 Tax=Fusibacter ferrireducens TaxID=2785058 RepID=A0ABR9ZZL0_9FIRM|nr:ABC transporter ATP-binding protein [Fusibacter ferrireducens]MBF4695879.1 ABC transporter ATP-binding protein [Fusibacter ferrireducens]